MKKILLITYYWPPAGGSGVQRWMYFAKYLKELGHEITVLTVDSDDATYSKFDPSLVENVSKIPVIYAKSFELTKLYSKIVSRNEHDGIPVGNIRNKDSFFQRMARFVRGNFFVPDSRVGWNKKAIKKAKEFLSTHEIDLVITTGPPHSTHLIGLALKKSHNIKWLSDFRDPWYEIYYNNLFIRTKYAKKKDLHLEAQVINKADHILTIGKNLCQMLQNKSTDRNKFHFIYNGYDEELLKNVIYKENSMFTIVFTGLLSSNQNTSGLLNLMRKIEQQVKRNEVRLIMAGSIDKEILNSFKAVLHQVEFIYLGYIPHQEAISLMANAQILVTILPNMELNEIMISGKIMEYISTRNPILMFGSEKSEATQLLNLAADACIVADESSDKSWEFFLDKFSNWKLKKENKVEHTFSIEKFSRKSTALELSNWIESL